MSTGRVEMRSVDVFTEKDSLLSRMREGNMAR